MRNMLEKVSVDSVGFEEDISVLLLVKVKLTHFLTNFNSNKWMTVSITN